MSKPVVMLAAAAALLVCAPGAALAEATEIRLARQFSMGYLQFNVLEHEKLIEKHAKAAGLGDVKVTWATFNGPDAMNAALIADTVDVVAGGVPGLVTLWAKTKGTSQAVRGISALSSQPFLLNTRNPNVRTIRDFTAADKIALPAIKVSVQAVTLQMAAAKEFGRAEQIYRDARALPIVGGTSEIVRYLIATADLPGIKPAL